MITPPNAAGIITQFNTLVASEASIDPNHIHSINLVSVIYDTYAGMYVAFVQNETFD